MVRITEIVKTADDVHICFQSFRFANQGAGSAGQAIEALAKGGIELFDEGGKVPLIFLAMDANISFSGLTPCRAGDIRAKYLVGVHWLLSRFGHQESLPLNPCFCKDLPQTTFSWSGTPMIIPPCLSTYIDQ